MNKIKGITLVALVVTIIVMLILSGVAINLSIGEEGIFKKAKEAVELYKNASVNGKEQIEELAEVIEENIDLRISNKEELESFRDRVNGGETFEGKVVKVVADIDLENEEWLPIGNYVDNNELKFKGTFEGGNHEIKGLNINGNKDYQGLFGMIEDAKVQNVRITNGNIKVGNYGGGVSGYGINSIIKNCTNGAEILSSKGYTGGIIGKIDGESVIDSCNNTAKIESTGTCGDEYGNTFLGGIVGRSEAEIINSNNNSEIISVASAAGGIVGGGYKNIVNCTNEGNITVNGVNTGEDSTVGGIIGNMKNASILSCINKGKITSEGRKAGGIVGQIYSEDENNVVTIEKSHNEGEISSNTIYVGGIAGYISIVNILNCYNIANIETEEGQIGGIVGYAASTNSKIENCYNMGSIYGKFIKEENYKNTIAGGIVGHNYGLISKCYNTGSITIENSQAGGIAGNSNGMISECYNKGKIESTGYNINGDSEVGGIVGNVNNNINACYNTGEIKGEGRIIGGIAGNTQTENIIQNCYTTFLVEKNLDLLRSYIVGWNQNTDNSPLNCFYKGNITEGESRLEEDMKTQEFIDLIGGNTYWKLDTENKNNGFVILNWQ